MSCKLETLKLTLGEDLIADVNRDSDDDGNLTPIDCTGWTIEAAIEYKSLLNIPLTIAFTDESIGLAELEITEETVAAITPRKGCKLVITWIDGGGRKRKTRTLVEVCDG